jgi:hypothetical protein
MIRQCAWCLKLLGEVEPLADTSVTHGMCDKCSDKMAKEVDAMRKALRKAS